MADVMYCHVLEVFYVDVFLSDFAAVSDTVVDRSYYSNDILTKIFTHFSPVHINDE